MTPLKFNSVCYTEEEPLILESGDTLRDFRIQYTTYGELNDEKSNVIWVFHALTGNSDPIEWWEGLVGGSGFINPERHFIICANMIGSCYGSTEPTSYEFPLISIHDIVKGFRKLKNHLEIGHIQLGIGGSMGGQILLEWAVQEPALFKTIVPIATNAIHSPWAIAFNETQRMALRLDPRKGIETARAIAMLSYRHYATYDKTQRDTDGRTENFSASSYQVYQGEKLNKRFSAYSYYALSRTMDSHNVGRHFQSISNALERIESKVFAIGVDSDILFPNQEQKMIADSTQNGSYRQVTSLYGHDGFLIETDQINEILKNECV
ncbi:MAG: homoserine O-acetyltransferase [Ekhidna sp.]|nr:homoserine O-acetyltransferase [Ekhidna sp.]MBC6408899.1 homoserine O-acetyltransferase [Ekhidna sp.]MBC6426511.1 homoserine O-acetyltransferase [Ekhidna sp.]